jgi:hypothetical protein
MGMFREFFGGGLGEDKKSEPVPGRGEEWEIGADDLNPERISRQIADISQQLMNPNLSRADRLNLETILDNLKHQQNKDLTGKPGY